MHCTAPGSYREEQGLIGPNRYAPTSTTNVETVAHDLEAEVTAIEAIGGVNFVYGERLRS